MKTPQTPDRATARPIDKGRGPTSGKDKEPARVPPRGESQPAQKGPGSASADVGMTSDGGKGRS